MTHPARGKLRAAVITSGNPRDVATWSGIPYHMLQVLERRFDVVEAVEAPWPRWFHKLGKLLKAASLGRWEYHFSKGYTRFAGRRLVATLKAAQPDVVLAISASPMAHLLVDDFRVVNIADATVRSMLGYYDSFTRHMGGDGSAADAIEARVVSGAFLSLYPSAWARDSALGDYGADPARTQIIEWGSNISAAATAPRTLPNGPLRLLFVGIEFDRKGGPLAIATAAALTARGIACQLDIVGADATAYGGAVPANVRFHGFVSKASPEGRAMIDTLFAEANFFVLPTRAECFGIVFAEAASRGLPSISFATGGVPSAVLSGVTGQLLPLTAGPEDFADAIAGIIASPARYTEMSRAALDDARTRLDWGVWADRVYRAVADRLAIEAR